MSCIASLKKLFLQNVELKEITFFIGAKPEYYINEEDIYINNSYYDNCYTAQHVNLLDGYNKLKEFLDLPGVDKFNERVRKILNSLYLEIKRERRKNKMLYLYEKINNLLNKQNKGDPYRRKLLFKRLTKFEINNKADPTKDLYVRIYRRSDGKIGIQSQIFYNNGSVTDWPEKVICEIET